MSAKKILLGILVLALVSVGLVQALEKGTSELPVYTKAGQRMMQGEEIYLPGEDKPFTYPPFFAVPLMPIALMPSESHRVVWYFANLGMLVLVLILLQRILRARGLHSDKKTPPLLWILIGLLSVRHVSAVFENQSHDFVILLLLTASISRDTKPGELRTGFCTGLAAACKATPLLFAPVLLWQRRFGALGLLLSAFVFFTWLPDLVFPPDGDSWAMSWWAHFGGKASAGTPIEAQGAWGAWNYLNQNLAGTIYRLSTPVETGKHIFDVSLWAPKTGILKMVTIACQLAALAIILFVCRRRLVKELAPGELAFRRLGEASVIVCGMVLLSPMSSKSHFCVLLLPIAFCLADYLDRRRDIFLGFLLLLVFAVGSLTAKGLLGSDLGNQVLARGSVTLTALLCLAASAHALYHRSRKLARERASGMSPDTTTLEDSWLKTQAEAVSES